jgi:hypothetical protein
MSLLPLGLLSQGGGASGGPGFELIQTTNGTGSSGIITFSSIPATYTHLQIRATIRGNYSSANMSSTITLNGDTAANYAQHQTLGNGSTVVATGTANTSSISGINYPAASGTANAFGSVLMEILDYKNTSKNKTIKFFNGFHAGSAYGASQNSGLWRNTSAITSITFTAALGSYVSATRFSLYGIRGA